MSLMLLLLVLLILSAAGYFLGRARAMRSAGGDRRILHSLPGYYGWSVALTTLLPALAALVLWIIVQPIIVDSQVSSMISEQTIEGSSLDLAMSDVVRVADGLDLAVSRGILTEEEASSIRAEFTDIRGRLGEIGVALGSDVSAETLLAAQAYRSLSMTGAVQDHRRPCPCHCRLRLRLPSDQQGLPRPEFGRGGRSLDPDLGGFDRHPDHRRHRPVADLQHGRVLPALSGRRLLLRPDLEPELRRRIANSASCR